MSSTKGTGTPHVAAETGRIRPAVERHSRRKIVVRLWSENSALGSSQRLSVVPVAVICSRICRTVRPRAFGSDNYAGVEDHSHAGGSRGLRFLVISSTSAAKSESIDDDLCPGAHWGHHTGKVAGASASEMWMTFFATAGIMPLPNVR